MLICFEKLELVQVLYFSDFGFKIELNSHPNEAKNQ